MHIKTWHVELFIYEQGDDTSARAVLHADSPEHAEGRGLSRRAPKDVDVPEIGDEVAAARALHALADALLATASDDIEAIRHEPVHLDFAGPVGVQRHPRT
ncbi:MAG: dsRBD fold-containing protein [Actinomycetes bacterium]